MLFDEAIHVIARTVPEVVTVSMAVDYKSPGFEGHRLICEAWVEKREGRRIEVSSALVDASTKKVVAEARAVYREVDLKRSSAASDGTFSEQFGSRCIPGQ